MKIFISYSKTSTPVKILAHDIELLGHKVWYDTELGGNGGSFWWTQILSQIHECHIMICALSAPYITSRACRSELDYALTCQRDILPIFLDETLTVDMLPLALATRESLRYFGEKADKDQALLLGRTLTNLAPGRKPRHPVPLGPETPMKIFNDLRDRIDQLHPDFEEQQKLVDDIEFYLSDPETMRDATALLTRLSKVENVLITKFYKEINVLLGKQTT